MERPNILVLCGRNKRRSRTADYIFKNDNRFNIRSAGLSPKSERVLTEKDLNWADLVFVMEPSQKSKVSGLFRHLQLPPIEILHIEDEYEFMDAELIDLLQERINSTLQLKYNL